ncbi:MAG: hypothetical protein K2Q22_04970, partial [Cytophagales bacterium]|nr:hypothetical protein [Cytophagales bacterium]
QHKPLCESNRDIGNGLVFSTVDLRWNEAEKSFVSKGKLGLLNSGRKEVNAMMDGFIEIKKSPQGDILNIYLNPQESIWYYIKVENNNVKLLSSDDAFNALAAKGKVAQGKYYYAMAEPAERVTFVKHFYRTYLGKEIELSDGSETEPTPEAQPETPVEEKKEEKPSGF